MTLADIVNQLNGAARDQIICVRRPWSALAESTLAQLDENLSVPSNVKAAGFEYFLEVFLARDVLQAFSDKCAALDDKIRLLLFYAENDAYPDWVYQ
jgi:hypothetical protein